MTAEFTVRTDCRLCGSADLVAAITLSPTPPANAFAASREAALAQSRYPLDLCLCQACGHLQLVDVVDPEILFRDYVYVSGTSPSFVTHFQRYADALIERLSLDHRDLVVDIGSNDGTLLKAFQRGGCRILGIDPATNIAAAATADGVPTLSEFFDVETAERIRSDHGRAKLITANNVFAHIDDLAGVVAGVHALLDKDGLFVFEVSYLVDVFEGTLFDTIYHEHLLYHRVGPLRTFFERHGMTLVDVERVDTHGGSLRGHARIGTHVPTQAVVLFEEEEKALGLDSFETYRAFQDRVARAGTELSALLSGLIASGKSVAAYGAPAKATTLMHQFELDGETIRYVIDDNPLKQGLFTPGLGIPVVASEVLEDDPPDYLVLLAWNFADAIIAKSRDYLSTGGRFVVPLPTLSVRDR
jgi:SAM-dependent methyltransferase